MRIYYVPFDLSSVGSAIDIAELKAATNHKITLLAAHIGKHGATTERLKLKVIRAGSGATSGSVPATGGGAVTPTAADSETLDAASFVAEVGNTSQISGGSPVTLAFDAYDPSSGYDFVPPNIPEQPSARNGEFLVLQLLTAPTNGLVSGYVTVGES